MSDQFDPRPHLRQLPSGAPYLDVKWRLHWLRSEHPDAEIATELLSSDGDLAVCKATVRLPGGGSATGHASATRAADSAYIEQAETRAIGRALAALGYGAEFAEDDAAASRGDRQVALVPPVVAPTAEPRVEERPAQPQEPTQLRQPARPRPVRDDIDADEDDEPTPPPRPRRDAAPVREVREQPVDADPERLSADLPTPLTRASDLRARPEPTGERAQAQDGADISWTKFWEWARRKGYRDAKHLKELLDIDVNALTPGEVRAHIRRYELENPPGDGDQE